MWAELNQYLSPDAVKLALTLFLSFLLGIEREQHKQKGSAYSFGGIRTLPLIALTGYALALLAGEGTALIGVGFGVVGAMMLASFWRRLAAGESGITSEVSALLVYLVGALLQRGHVWLGSTLVVVSVLLLELKAWLETLTTRISGDEVFAFAKFLLLTIVILPIIPHRELGRFHLDPLEIWLVVVAVSAVSYGSYLLALLVRGRGGVLVTALLGGAYSSTVTTMVLAKQSAGDEQPRRYAGAILAASGVMYLRLLVLLALFNRALVRTLLVPFLVLAALAIAGGAIWSLQRDRAVGPPPVHKEARNPLELRSALLFAALFVFMIVATQYAAQHLGRGGIFTLASLMGLADVDPFILGLAQVPATPMLRVSAEAVLIAAASNDLAKGGYALIFAGRRTGRMSALLLLTLAALGLSPLLWL